MAPAKTATRGKRMDMTAAMRKVLSPSSVAIVMLMALKVATLKAEEAAEILAPTVASSPLSAAAVHSSRLMESSLGDTSTMANEASCLLREATAWSASLAPACFSARDVAATPRSTHTGKSKRSSLMFGIEACSRDLQSRTAKLTVRCGDQGALKWARCLHVLQALRTRHRLRCNVAYICAE
jgi:hypothetical protein